MRLSSGQACLANQMVLGNLGLGALGGLRLVGLGLCWIFSGRGLGGLRLVGLVGVCVGLCRFLLGSRLVGVCVGKIFP